MRKACKYVGHPFELSRQVLRLAAPSSRCSSAQFRVSGSTMSHSSLTILSHIMLFLSLMEVISGISAHLGVSLILEKAGIWPLHSERFARCTARRNLPGRFRFSFNRCSSMSPRNICGIHGQYSIQSEYPREISGISILPISSDSAPTLWHLSLAYN